MPGLRWVNGEDSGRLDDWQPEGMARPAGALPDFDDAATLGCLLALVREAWVDPMARICTLHYARRWFIDLPSGEVIFGATEAAALVAALEAAP